MTKQPEALRLADASDKEIRRTVALDVMHHDISAELRRLHALCEERELLMEQARDALDDASTSVADWGSYASEYFQSKHDLKGNIKQFRDASDTITNHLRQHEGEKHD